MNLKCLIVDDEPIARKIIEGYVEKMSDVECIGTCSNGIDALNFIQTNSVDLVFLDINMPELSGIDVAKTFIGRDSPAIVFTTAYPDYAVEGFEVEATDYLVKPISFERFFKAIQRVQSSIEKATSTEKKSIFIKADRKLHQVELVDILYLEAYGDYVKVHCREKMLVTKERLSNFDSLLPTSMFVRTHRSYIVQFAVIEYLEGNHVRIGEAMIPVSQGYRGRLEI
jgi:DNA-binding LytR/AlgR family response regulator